MWPGAGPTIELGVTVRVAGSLRSLTVRLTAPVAPPVTVVSARFAASNATFSIPPEAFVTVPGVPLELMPMLSVPPPPSTLKLWIGPPPCETAAVAEPAPEMLSDPSLRTLITSPFPSWNVYVGVGEALYDTEF